MQDGVFVAERSSFHGDVWLEMPVKLHSGRNLMHFYCPDAPTVKSLLNGDPRHLMVMLYSAMVEAVNP